MKNAMPPSTITAPAAIAIAAPPDSEELPDDGVVATVGGAVAVDAVGPDGSPGANGLLPPAPLGTTPVEPAAPVGAASATTGVRNAITPTITDTHASRRTMRRTYRSDASGCSIAGVSGAVRYGSSFS